MQLDRHVFPLTQLLIAFHEEIAPSSHGSCSAHSAPHKHSVSRFLIQSTKGMNQLVREPESPECGSHAFDDLVSSSPNYLMGLYLRPYQRWKLQPAVSFAHGLSSDVYKRWTALLGPLLVPRFLTISASAASTRFSSALLVHQKILTIHHGKGIRKRDNAPSFTRKYSSISIGPCTPIDSPVPRTHSPRKGWASVLLFDCYLTESSKPTGTILMFWPFGMYLSVPGPQFHNHWCHLLAWGLTLSAYRTRLPLAVYGLDLIKCIVGAFLLRSSACTVNDIFDRDVDAGVGW